VKLLSRTSDWRLARPKEDVFDRQLQVLVCRDADRIRHAPLLQRLVDRRFGEGGIGSEGDLTIALVFGDARKTRPLRYLFG
jgi:hypothetical protein